MNDQVKTSRWQTIKKLVETYQPLETTKELVSKMRLVLLTGITGAGKDTLAASMLRNPDYRWIVSYATRQPRMNDGVMEKDGEKYHFVDDGKVLEMLKNHEFVEAKIVHEEVRGTGVQELAEIHRAGKIALKDIDYQGAIDYHYLSKNATAIFVVPPSYEVWISRLERRYTGAGGLDPADFNKRLASAKKELAAALTHDFFQLVINDDLDQATTAVAALAHTQPQPASEKAAALVVIREILDKL
jgi:guanylate kinase